MILTARILEWFAILSSSGPCFVRTPHYDPICLGWPCKAWLIASLSYASPSAMIRLPSWLSGKESACHCRRCKFNPFVRKIPWRWKYQPTPVFLPGKLHEQRSLASYSLWGHKESRHDWACTHECIIYNFYSCAKQRSFSKFSNLK